VNAIVRDADGRFAPAAPQRCCSPREPPGCSCRAPRRPQGDLTRIRVWQGERAELRWVRLGAERGDMVEVLSGLRSGEMIALPRITEGN
jgi:hypothetical protein